VAVKRCTPQARAERMRLGLGEAEVMEGIPLEG